MAQKLLFPQKYVNITQGSYGGYSHKNRMAIDSADKDAGASNVYSPGYGEILYIEDAHDSHSTVKFNNVVSPTGKEYDFITGYFYHQKPLDKFKKGDMLDQLEMFMKEGTNYEPGGGASGNHVHVETWMVTSRNKRSGNSVKPEDLFFLKRGYHVYLGSKSSTPLYWLADNKNQDVDQIEVKATSYRIRKTPNSQGEIIGFAEVGYWTIEELKEVDGMVWAKVYHDMWIGLTDNAVLIPKVEKEPEVKLYEIYTVKKDDLDNGVVRFKTKGAKAGDIILLKR
jgi:hypothetical protein